MGHAPEPALSTPAPALWRRAGALVTDALTVFFLMWALAVVQVLWFVDDLSRSLDPGPWHGSFVVTVVYTVSFAIYQMVFLAGNEGRSPGKELFGVQVVGADGGRPSPAVCLRRTLAVAPLWMVPPLWCAIGLVAATGLPSLAGLGGRARSWPDLVAGTSTVRSVTERAKPAADENGDTRAEAAPPTVFTLLVGRKNARRFARTERAEPDPDAGRGGERRR